MLPRSFLPLIYLLLLVLVFASSLDAIIGNCAGDQLHGDQSDLVKNITLILHATYVPLGNNCTPLGSAGAVSNTGRILISFYYLCLTGFSPDSSGTHHSHDYTTYARYGLPAFTAIDET